MSRATQTIGAGFKALGGASMSAYTLEFLTQSGSRRPGTTETIVVPHAEMGRDRTCAIRFDASEKTVSRKHASISSEGGQYYITPLSQTNQTFVNGAAINGRVPLSNGSEIQLSSSGPRMRFLAAQTKTSTMRLTQRMQMFASQSLRPYRRAVMTLSVVFVIAIGAMAYFLYQSSEELGVAKKQIAQQIEEQKQNKEAQKVLNDNLAKVNKDLAATAKKLAEESKKNSEILKQVEISNNIKKMLDDYENDVYYLHMSKLVYRFNGEVNSYSNLGSGTGFLLDDGRFVTALHCVHPWYFNTEDESYNILNALKTQGEIVELTIVATSPSGKQMTFSSNDFNYNEAGLESRTYEIDGDDYLVRVNTSNTWKSDWAWIHTSQKGKIKSDAFFSKNMEANDHIYVMGYTFGMSQQPEGGLKPLHSEMTVAQDGLTKGVVKVSGRSFDSGNSGGPAFAVNKNGELVNIGIISSGRQVVGQIVPIANVR